MLVARDDPLDTYLVHHPEALFGRPVEATVLDPANPYVLGPHLCCAAAELPLTEADLDAVRRRPRRPVLDALVAAGALRRRPTGWYWTARAAARTSTCAAPAARRSRVVEAATGRLLGTVDAGVVALHAARRRGLPAPGRVVRGRRPGPGRRRAPWCTREEPDWSTHARDVTDAVGGGGARRTWTPARSACSSARSR